METMGWNMRGEANCPRNMNVVSPPSIRPLEEGDEMVTKQRLELGMIKPAPKPAMTSPGYNVP